MTLTLQKSFLTFFHTFTYFFFTIRIWIAKLLWPDDQAENSDDHAKLICCNRFREETNWPCYLNCKISRLSVRVKSSCERCVYTVKRQIQCHILSKGGDVQFQRAIRTIYTLTAELVKTCWNKTTENDLVLYIYNYGRQMF